MKTTPPTSFSWNLVTKNQQHYARLLRHGARHIRHDELVGDIPKGALDAPEIVDEVGRQVFGEARQKPKQMSWPLWFYHLVREELRRQRRIFRRKQIEEVPLDETKTLPEDAEAAEGWGEGKSNKTKLFFPTLSSSFVGREGEVFMSQNYCADM